MIYQVFSEILGVLVFLFIVRVFIVYLRIHKKKNVIDRTRFTAKLMIVLGSGGHTFEMLHLLRNASKKISPRIYVLAKTDNLSAKKAKKFEEEKSNSEYVLEKIPRSREVGQSWITSFFTTLKACFSAFQVVYRHWPEAVLCNGPGTCVPVCLSAFLLHVCGLKHITIIYVESMCRVKTMSLTGKMLYHISDHFFVHWTELKEKYPRAQYVGRIF